MHRGRCRLGGQGHIFASPTGGPPVPLRACTKWAGGCRAHHPPAHRGVAGQRRCVPERRDAPSGSCTAQAPWRASLVWADTPLVLPCVLALEAAVQALAASLWRDAPLRRVGLRGHGRRTPPYDQHQARRIRPGPRPKRRTFSAEYKLRIAAEYDAAPKNEKGAILRRERLYHSHVKERRAARDAGACRSWSTSTPARRGRRSLLPRWRTIDCGATWSVWRRNWPGTRPR